MARIAAIVLVVLAGFLAVPALHAQQSEGAQQSGDAIRGVISDQIDAFRADDFERAFSFASPGIRGIFGDADRFGAMVRQGYPMVYRPAEVTFLDLRDAGGALVQKVIIRDAAGAVHVLEYEMVPDGEGWRIDGVRLLEAAQLGA